MHKLAGFPPKVFIIGAQKAGTTQLSEFLDQHQDICLCSPKEPDFFTRYYGKGLDWYKSLFTDPGKVLIDASTSYTSRPLPSLYEDDQEDEQDPLIGVPQRIAEASPDARLIYIMREPVARAYSGYWHQVRAGHESRTLADAMNNTSYYKRISKYAEQLAYYTEHFNPKNILLVTFDDLIKADLQTVNACLEFLELPPMTEIDSGLHKNKSFQYPWPLDVINRRLSSKGGLNAVLKKVRKRVPSSVVDRLKSKVTKPVPKMSDADKQVIEQFLEDEVSKAKTMLQDAQQQGTKK